MPGLPASYKGRSQQLSPSVVQMTPHISVDRCSGHEFMQNNDISEETGRDFSIHIDGIIAI